MRLIAEGLKQVRFELFGENGAPELARKLGLPTRTWVNYESGVTIPGKILLRFLILTGAEPLWLLQGQGQQYKTGTWSTSHR